MVRIVVDNRVRVPEARAALGGEVVAEIEEAFAHKNPAFLALRNMGYSTAGEPPVIETHLLERGELSVPRGGMAAVRAVLRRRGVRYAVEDRRSFGDAAAGAEIPASGRAPWPFQAEVLDAVVARENCLIRAPTGGGKTSIGIYLGARVKTPTLFVVWCGGLFRQWRERLADELGLADADVGSIRGARWKVKPVTVAMMQTLAARDLPAEVDRYFGAYVFDEVQRAAAATSYRATDKFSARYRVGISASERRRDRKEFLTYDLFGEVVADVDRERLVREGFILDVEARVVPTPFEAGWYGHPSEDKELDVKRLLDELTADERRNEEAVGYAVAEARAGEQVIVLSRRVEHCKLLCRMLVERGVRTGFLLGGKDNELEYQRSVEGLRSGAVQVGVGTYEALGTGIDLPRVGVGIATTPIAADKGFFTQVRGRLCRSAPGKRAARLYYLWDHRVHPAHLANLVAWNPSVVVRFPGNRWVDGREAKRRLRAGELLTA